MSQMAIMRESRSGAALARGGEGGETLVSLWPCELHGRGMGVRVGGGAPAITLSLVT